MLSRLLPALLLINACSSGNSPPAAQTPAGHPPPQPYPQQQYPQQPQPYPQQQYPQQPQPYPQQQYPQQPQPYPQQQYPQQPQPYPQQPAQPATPAAPQPALPTAVLPVLDPSRDLAQLRSLAKTTLGELVGALQGASRQRVEGIPLVVDDTVGEVNAFAACSKTGKSAMAITDGLLKIQVSLALAQAHDEIFGSQSLDEYIRFVASAMQPQKPVPAPPAQLFPGAGDPRIGTRQRQILEEQIAFVLGHELGHHHLGHLPCTATGAGAGDLGRVLSNQVPLFNQPNEVTADLAGTQNVLDAGRNRAARGKYQWTEAGGLLTMRFFSGFSRLTPGTLLTGFERSHPPPQLRTPIIQQAAQAWRTSGGRPLPVPGLNF